MGSSQSKSGMRRNTSAAFGRLRIDSPRATPGSGRMSFGRRKELRMAAEGGGPVLVPVSIPLSVPVPSSTSFSSEQSPLMLSSPRILEGQYDSSMGMDSLGSPPLAVWIVPALCCAMAYALYNIFIKKGSSHINPVMGGVILQLVAATLGCCLLAFLVWKEGGAAMITYDTEGIQWAILAGVAVGVAEIVSFFVSSLGVQAMQSIPIIIGGSVMFGTVLGAVALHEELSYRGWSGVILISLGISLVGMDDSGDGI
jgi:transporter family protein